jgi:hypothetical protein
VYAYNDVDASETLVPLKSGKIPVTYVTPEQADDIIRESRLKGYTVREAAFQQLAELEQGVQPEAVTTGDKEPCEKNNRKDCNAESDKETAQKPVEVDMPVTDAAPYPPPEPLPPPQPPAVQTNVGVYADVAYGSGSGGSSDAGKVFFIIAGVMVIAAFIVYTVKYITDISSGKEFKTWWEFIFSNTYLSTRSGQHGRLNGLKIGTGFVSSDLIQIALIGEFGNTNIDVILDEYGSNPEPLDFSASYWLLGASARLHLSDKLVNASYLYLDFMGGKTNNDSTDTIGMARIGASFGINDYLRLGASIGSYYVGLDEDQGFVNNDDNYWTTFGFEVGAKF